MILSIFLRPSFPPSSSSLFPSPLLPSLFLLPVSFICEPHRNSLKFCRNLLLISRFLLGSGMEPNTIPDYWNDDAGGASDGELRYALESFCDVPPTDAGSGFKGVYENCCGMVQVGSRKRVSDDAYPGSKSKACREKMRRDRLNDRFLELSSVLDPGRPPKSDKANILTDAARMLLKLKTEAEQLKESNEKLQETIKEIKAEKSELRDEKLRLKLEKEKLEQQAGFITHPIAYHPSANPAAAAAIYAAHAKPHAKKTAPFNSFPGMAMWQWLPPAILDTTQDPMLWPPHA